MAQDLMNDIQAPDLTERLARYVGALRLREAGSVTDEFVSRKLEDLQVACRAADRLLDVTLYPQKLREVSDAMHRKLTTPKETVRCAKCCDTGLLHHGVRHPRSACPGEHCSGWSRCSCISAAPSASCQE